MFLSLLMAFSAFGVLTPVAFAEGSAGDNLWTDLANALRSENVKSATYVSSGNNVTVDDKSGDVTKAAQAYLAVVSAYVHRA